MSEYVGTEHYAEQKVCQGINAAAVVVVKQNFGKEHRSEAVRYAKVDGYVWDASWQTEKKSGKAYVLVTVNRVVDGRTLTFGSGRYVGMEG